MDALDDVGSVAYPWGDLRLWAFPLLLAAVGGLADAAWGGVFPGRAPNVWGACLACGLVAAGATATALHPRAARWTAGGNVLPALWAILIAFALARPVSGPRFWAFAWGCALLLYIWSKARAFVRSAIRLTLSYPFGRRAGLAPAAGEGLTGAAFAAHMAHATIEVLWGVGMWVALCDLGRRTVASAGHIPLALAAVAAALCLASWAQRAQVWAEAAAADVRVQAGFQRYWWWTVVPVVCVCLIVGILVPSYPAPLQHGSVGAAVVRIASFWAPTLHPGHPLLPAAPRPAPPPGDGGLLVALLPVVFVLALAWPLRRLTVRLLERGGLPEALPADGPAEGSERGGWRGWWARLLAFWRRLRRRQPRLWGEPNWRPRDPPPLLRPTPPSRGPEAARDDMRGRVRAAYARLLHSARRFGLGRRDADSPRAYQAWLRERAPAGQAAMAQLTQAYEEARYSRHPVDQHAAEGAEQDAQAVTYALDMLTRARRPQPQREEHLHWTAPRGFGRGKQT